MERRSFIAILVALFVAPFIRFFERFWPKKLQGTDEYIDFGKVADFDPNEPFSVSFWFKSKPLPGDRSYLFESTSRNKISETTLLDDVTDKEWRTFSVRYLGDTKKDPEVFIDGLRSGERLPPGAVQLWKGSDDVAGDDALSQVEPLLLSGDRVEPPTSLPPTVG